MLKEIKWGAIFTSVMYLLLGIVLIVYPDATARTLCYVGAGLGIALGVVTVLSYFFKELQVSYYRNDFVIGLLEVILGIFVIYKVDLMVALVPFIIGLFVLISGFIKIQNGIDARRFHYDGWMTYVMLGVINIIFGAVLLWNPFQVASVLFMMLGVGLAYSGITDLIITIHLSRKIKKFMKDAEQQPTRIVDVDVPPEDYEDRNLEDHGGDDL